MRTGQALPLKTSRPWAPRDAIAPRTCRDGDTFVITSNSRPGCYGGWDLAYPILKPGQWVRIRAKVRWQDLERSYDSVSAAMLWTDGKGGIWGTGIAAWEPLLPIGMDNGWVVYEGQMPAPKCADSLVVRLLMCGSATGELRWAVPEVRRIAAPKSRPVRLGAAGGHPPPGAHTVDSNTSFYLQYCRQAADRGIDLLCLPEVMLVSGMPSNAQTIPQQAIKIPGKETRPFQKFAREHHLALCFSAWEKNGDRVHNTAMLIDKHGEIAGKYRKVHLAQPFEIWWGVTPGDEFGVFDLGWAKIGMNICMDSSAAESARTLARQGAEIVCLPIMGDHRASTCFDFPGQPHDFDVERWTMIQRMRAMDNHVYMVVSRNSGVGTGIFSPRGRTLTMSGGTPLVYADVDLADLPREFLGTTFRGICWCERREPTYAPLVQALVEDPFRK
ncbi:MAG: hypothetical protein A3K19_26365 [Lentisphaerae bacterium RIFOXYB12_FULL_65_16]|nr:MAG: hypothetical protein A3K18_08535 [Lentisphaerae bacterium RIFOXYA12_64_32]OGV87800.1 MAG: hypothetical protein A3K19_26365 [Lentisphaerae bacterium RIFOXYB12_FULL_65_16]